MAVNGEAVQQVQHQHNEYQLVQPPDDADIQYSRRRRKTRKGADDRRQMRRIGGDDGGNTDIKEQEKVKVLRLRSN